MAKICIVEGQDRQIPLPVVPEGNNLLEAADRPQGLGIAKDFVVSATGTFTPPRVIEANYKVETEE